MLGDFLVGGRGRSRAVPVHYDDYGVMCSGLDDARAAAREAGFAERLDVVPRGGTVALGRAEWPIDIGAFRAAWVTSVWVRRGSHCRAARRGPPDDGVARSPSARRAGRPSSTMTEGR